MKLSHFNEFKMLKYCQESEIFKLSLKKFKMHWDDWQEKGLGLNLLFPLMNRLCDALSFIHTLPCPAAM